MNKPNNKIIHYKNNLNNFKEKLTKETQKKQKKRKVKNKNFML